MVHMENETGNTVGIVAVSIGWLIPLAGLILGIISLARRERAIFGTVAVVESVVFWIAGIASLSGWGHLDTELIKIYNLKGGLK